VVSARVGHHGTHFRSRARRRLLGREALHTPTDRPSGAHGPGTQSRRRARAPSPPLPARVDARTRIAAELARTGFSDAHDQSQCALRARRWCLQPKRETVARLRPGGFLTSRTGAADGAWGVGSGRVRARACKGTLSGTAGAPRRAHEATPTPAPQHLGAREKAENRKARYDEVGCWCGPTRTIYRRRAG
jgi:hypothetical protein